MDDLIALSSKEGSKLGLVLVEDSYLQSSWPILNRLDGYASIGGIH